MADIFSKKKRSSIMSSIRSKGTAPEVRLLKIIRSLANGRKVVPNKSLAGVSVDAYIPSLKAAIFCDGCFYHMCPVHGHIPKSNKKYWAPKLARNKYRDLKSRRLLSEAGFAVWRVWEHSLTPSRINYTLARMRRLLDKRASNNSEVVKPATGGRSE